MAAARSIRRCRATHAAIIRVASRSPA